MAAAAAAKRLGGGHRLFILRAKQFNLTPRLGGSFPESNPSPLQCGWHGDVISHQYRTWELLSHLKRHDLREHSWRSEGDGELRQELYLSLKKTRFSASIKGLFWFRRRVPSKPAQLLSLIHFFHRRRFNVEQVPSACVWSERKILFCLL